MVLPTFSGSQVCESTSTHLGDGHQIHLQTSHDSAPSHLSFGRRSWGDRHSFVAVQRGFGSSKNHPTNLIWSPLGQWTNGIEHGVKHGLKISVDLYDPYYAFTSLNPTQRVAKARVSWLFKPFEASNSQGCFSSMDISFSWAPLKIIIPGQKNGPCLTTLDIRDPAPGPSPPPAPDNQTWQWNIRQ